MGDSECHQHRAEFWPMWQRQGTPEATVCPSTPASRPGQVYYYYRHLDPSSALCPVESFSISCLWTNKAPHVVVGLFRGTKDSLPASLRNFWGTSHRTEVKPNIKLNLPLIRVWLSALLITSVQGTRRNHTHMWRGNKVTFPGKGNPNQCPLEIIKPVVFLTSEPSSEMWDYHQFFHGIHKPADAVYGTFINE